MSKTRTCAICHEEISADTGYMCRCMMSEPEEGFGPQGEEYLEALMCQGEE